MVTMLSKIWNSKSLRLPKPLIIKYHLESGIIIKENKDGNQIQPAKNDKLSWNETFKEMKATKEDWSDWEAVNGDGLE